MFKKWILLIVSVLIVSSCATGEMMSRLSPGMNKKEVVKILGKYDGYKNEGEYEILSYNHRLVTGWAWDRADYKVILKEDKVVEWGQGEVRVKNVGGLHTVLLIN